MKLNSLSLRDKARINAYLRQSPHELSAYSFENIFIWGKLCDVSWGLSHGQLLIFFRDAGGQFLFLPPLGKKQSPAAISEAFRVMDRRNRNPQVSRIENIEESSRAYYQAQGLVCVSKFPEYLHKRNDLVQLRGDAFKPKRASLNYFQKNYHFSDEPLDKGDAQECLKLYTDWAKQRSLGNSDRVYRGMLEDSRVCLRHLLNSFNSLDVTGRVVKVDGRVKGFTIGTGLNADTFCVIYEVTDLECKGLAQHIFNSLCRQLEGFKYINTMDDSGLDNLRIVKRSYRPVRLVPAYIATRRPG